MTRQEDIRREKLHCTKHITLCLYCTMFILFILRKVCHTDVHFNLLRYNWTLFSLCNVSLTRTKNTINMHRKAQVDLPFILVPGLKCYTAFKQDASFHPSNPPPKKLKSYQFLNVHTLIIAVCTKSTIN